MTGRDPAVAGVACTVAGNCNAVTARTFTVAGHCGWQVAGMSKQPVGSQRAHVHWISDPSVMGNTFTTGIATNGTATTGDMIHVTPHSFGGNPIPTVIWCQPHSYGGDHIIIL